MRRVIKNSTWRKGATVKKQPTCPWRTGRLCRVPQAGPSCLDGQPGCGRTSRSVSSRSGSKNRGAKNPALVNTVMSDRLVRYKGCYQAVRGGRCSSHKVSNRMPMLISTLNPGNIQVRWYSACQSSPVSGIRWRDLSFAEALILRARIREIPAEGFDLSR